LPFASIGNLAAGQEIISVMLSPSEYGYRLPKFKNLNYNKKLKTVFKYRSTLGKLSILVFNNFAKLNVIV